MNARRKGSDLTGLTLAALALGMVAIALVPGLGRGAQVKPKPPRAVFGSLITRYCRLWTAAARERDPAQAAPLYAKDTGSCSTGWARRNITAGALTGGE